MTSGSLSALWDCYGDAFRLHSHQLLAWAHADIRARLHPNLDEPAITGLLAEAMKARLNDHPDTPDAYLHYCIGDQEPISPNGELGNDRLRLDISIIRSGIRPRLSFVFEAKRLKTGGYPIGKYVGEGGIGDFISCRYASDCPEAAMIGLFQNRDITYWHAEFHRAFEIDKSASPSLLRASGKPTTVTVLAYLDAELESFHAKISGAPFRLFHVFLDCR
ncbi:MAG: hypothetical protein EOP84_03085 [Verrucomicrobiaceae bacterium]|nr:MAG: hypothetical protein EOP84_03085 [Verrucomicrobiaceae bacterium]